MTERQRNGNPVFDGRRARVPDGSRVYAVGDIHGRADLLAGILEKIRIDAETACGLRRVLVFLGDYVDRGPDSFGVVQSLASDPMDGFETVHLKGNHEDFLLGFLEDVSLAAPWMTNGGMATLDSYGVRVFDMLLGAGRRERVRRRLAEALPPDHLAFYRGLALFHVEGDYLFVHAGVRPGVPLEQQTELDILWIREGFVDCDGPLPKTVVHGHTISRHPDVGPQRIGIDTGAFHSGCLTCLVLEGESTRFLQT